MRKGLTYCCLQLVIYCGRLPADYTRRCESLLAGQKQQKFALNSADKVYLELRDLSFAAVGPKLSERAKSLQTDYKGSKGSERSLAELKDFAAQLKSLPNITRHINLAEAVNRVIARQNFRDRVTVEQSLEDGHSVDACCEPIEVIFFTSCACLHGMTDLLQCENWFWSFCFQNKHTDSASHAQWLTAHASHMTLAAACFAVPVESPANPMHVCTS